MLDALLLPLCELTGDDFLDLDASVEILFESYPASQRTLNPVADDVVDYLAELGLALEDSPSPNFSNGHIMMRYGCGTECQAHIVLNGPDQGYVTGPVSGYGSSWSHMSTLLIVNPPEELVYFQSDLVPARLYPKCYAFDGSDFEQVTCHGLPGQAC